MIQKDPFEDILTLKDKTTQNLTIFELLLTEEYFKLIGKTRYSDKYVFALTDYLDDLKERSEDLAYKMLKLFRQLFLNDYIVALKLKGSYPLKVHFMFAFDYEELTPEESANYEPVPAKLLWQEMHVN